MTEQHKENHNVSIVVVDADLADYTSLLNLQSSVETEVSIYLFSSARTALRVLPDSIGQRIPVNWFLINTVLPDMSGFDLLQMLRSRLNRAASVLVGSQYHPEDELTARRVGSAMYVCKPLHPSWFDDLEQFYIPPAGTEPEQVTTSREKKEKHNVTHTDFLDSSR